MARLVPAVVPDASVILKWVLDPVTEPGQAQAGMLLRRWHQGEIDLLVPALWLFEVGNVLCRTRPADAWTTLATLQDLGLTEVALNRGLVRRTVSLAQDHGITFYDAAYLALAQESNASLVTADERFCRRLPTTYGVELLK